MKWFSQIKKKLKYVLGVAAAALLISQVISPAIGINADGPRFNFLPGDQELFRGFNSTRDTQDDDWRDPVDGQAGDVIDGLIYYHNGQVNTTAENTTIKVSMPAQTTNKTAVLSATISADSVAAVSDTLTVNLDQNATLKLVPGSVKWFPNQASNPDINNPTPLPFGQDGSELLSSSGLNIGDINGCWEFAGFVMFQFKTTAKVNPGNLHIEKAVRNISKNETSFVERTSVDQNESVEYKINITNPGESTLEEVTASDGLPSDLTYVDNSLTMTKEDSTTNLDAAGFFASGVSIGSLKVGAENGAVIKFRAKAPSYILVAKSVTNVAYAISGNINVNDEAIVDLKAGVVNIHRSKSAYNDTLKVDATSTPARPGDVIIYTLNTKNTGTIATNFVVSDGIGDVLEESNIVSISNGGIVKDNPEEGNNSKEVIWPEVRIDPGQNVVRKFTVKVMDPLPDNPQNGFHFDDKLFNEYGNTITIIILRPHREPVLSINKVVRNITSNELEFSKSNTAFPGDMLEYKIDFANTGDGPADQVKISDVLPANVALDTSVPAIINLDGTEHVISEDVTKGFIINTLAPGQSGYVRFRVITSANIAAGEQLINTGYLSMGGNTISSTAQTVILTKVVPASTPLPKTGAAAGGVLSLLGSLFAGVNLTYLKQKKLLTKASRKSVN
ncbi:MAG: hypothetical protein WC080_03940 [Patescibacteria group bacterium]